MHFRLTESANFSLLVGKVLDKFIVYLKDYKVAILSMPRKKT